MGRPNYRNQAEEAFRVVAEREGFEITKRGWPDFFCKRDGRVICVEVKPHTQRKPKVEQREILEFLTAHGIECYLWTPDGGLQRV